MTVRIHRSNRGTLTCMALLIGWSAVSQAAPEVCAKISPEVLTTTLGDKFAAPVQTSAPAGEYKGDYVSCLYTANSITFEIRRWGYPNAVLRTRNLQMAKARYGSSARARKISDLGDSAWAFNEFVDVIQGPYEYYFAAYPTEPPNYHVDQTEKLTTIAKLFLSAQ